MGPFFCIFSGSTLAEKMNNFRLLETRGYIVEDLLSSKQPGTIRSYLCSLRLFVQFLKQEEIVDCASCDRCILLINSWYTSQKDPARERVHEVRAKQRVHAEASGESDVLSTCLQSEIARRAVVIFGTVMQHQSVEAVTAVDLVIARNHIMVLLGLANNQRSGGVINITVDECQNRVIKDDTAVIMVRNHKTFSSYGHARIVMTSVTSTLLDTYLNFMRPIYRGATRVYGQQPLFLTALGEQVSHSAMAILVKKQLGKDITLTANRKRVVTSRREAGADENELDNLAEHMTHSRATQGRYYDVSDRIDRSISVFKQLQQVRESTLGTSPDSNIVQPSTNAKKRPVSSTIVRPTVESPADPSPTTSPIGAAAASSFRTPSMTTSTHSRRAGYTEEQESAILRLYRLEIREGKITMSGIRSTRKAYPDDADCLKDYSDKQLFDKIRCLIKKK